ncbi:tRNA (adenosine(37)-N6)-dimethylallyltransferase MiaA [Flaviflagellibacter deserti]|uniref:tRNA dimethylallyltransferase n=1 Tax=Flaviflagellibacter deserti TaxID=2267266 RepID=A0ABV9Z6S7_9HYPH
MNKPVPSQPRIILLAGPTASGKSAAALRLTEETGGTIVNADSMQVYRDLRLLTSRPPEADEARAPHLLYGHVDGAEAYSVGRWLADVEPVVTQAREDGRILIFVGGTGLYFEALTQGISPVPDIPEAVRQHWRTRGAEASTEDLHRELGRRDPEMARRLRPSDPQRVIRALEVLEATGSSLSHWQEVASRPLIDPGQAERYVFKVERTELRRRIGVRFQTMIEQGALDEVRAIMDRGLDPALPVMRAIGVPLLAAHLRGEMSLQAAIDLSITETRQYAKRQDTWMRRRFGDWPEFPITEA